MATTHISIEMPAADLSLLELMAQRMGWKVGKAAVQKPSIDVSLDEARHGQIRSFNNVDDLMKDLME